MSTFTFSLTCDRAEGWWEAAILRNGRLVVEPYRDSYLGIAQYLIRKGFGLELPEMMRWELRRHERQVADMVAGRRNIYVTCHQCGNTHSDHPEDCQVKIGEWTWYRWDCGCSEHVYDNTEVSA